MSAGLVRDARHYYRWEGGPKVPGVTTVIKTLDKSGPLIGWAQRETAVAAVRNVSSLAAHIENHRMPDPLCPICTSAGATWNGPSDAAVLWLKRMPGYQRDASADLGTRVHAKAEALARRARLAGTAEFLRTPEVEITPDEAPFVTAYILWKERSRAQIVNAEYMVYSESHRYGGTADAAFWIAGELWLGDYKTGSSVFPETALQLAGLHGADWAGVPGDSKKYALPKATRFGVLHIRPEGAELIPYDVGPQEFDAFLACRRLLAWTTDRAPLIKGEVELREAA